MSVKQIDEALQIWNARLGTAAQNLIDLQSHPIYKRISAPDANLSGETSQKAGIAVRTLSYSLQCFDLLQGAIGRAEELRNDMPALFGAEEREREIGQVLQGKSIHLPAVQVPLNQRSLLTSIENVDAISPSELLTFMESAFEDVKQIIVRLEAAWEKLGHAIDETEQGARALLDRAEALTPSDRVELNNATQQLRAVQDAASEDPLGPAAQLLDRVKDTVQKIGAGLKQRERERQQVQQARTEARNLLDRLKSGHERARAAYLEASEKTGNMPGFEDSERNLNGLIAWFNRLISANADTAPSALLTGLKNWTNAAQQAMAADTATFSRAKQLLEARLELRGRLDALKAKARAYSLAENDELVALADKAVALLYRRPTNLEEAACAVSAYESKLNSQAGKHV